MKVFSLFSGIGGFELGIQMASKEVEVIGYSEIDKYAIQVYEKTFSRNKELRKRNYNRWRTAPRL